MTDVRTPPAQSARTSTHYRFPLGSMQATIIADGPIPLGPPENTFVDQPAHELRQMMTDLGLPADNVLIQQNALVIDTGKHLALFETGMNSMKVTPDMGKLPENLRAAGFDPSDIDYVIATHTHIDHIGGILAEDGSRNFPNAQIFVGQSDLEYWSSDDRIGQPGEHSLHAVRKNLLPNRDRILFYQDGKDVIPGVQAMLTPGHTIGHTSFVISSEGAALFVLGDLVHHQLVVQKPRMEDFYDTDRRLGIETRIKVMDMLAAQQMLALGYHLQWPGLGYFSKRGEGFQFEPASI
jgi:glyoxylase-like metal-dependent hydrolase (beta-lactamase superfamily II)